ncbi:MAG: hypothetical protein C0596_15845 [Marinilabiliales bacterium]|mgnify:CR=1 FL=1|nr:MAG: hypothetical protein C0596_15845 [Marinilabiliales bacterium]
MKSKIKFSILVSLLGLGLFIIVVSCNNSNLKSSVSRIDEQESSPVSEDTINESLPTESDFESFLALFDDITEEKIQIVNMGEVKSGPEIGKSDIKKYFELEVTEIYEGCVLYRVFALGKFEVSDDYIALLTQENHCPVSNVDWLFPLYVFDKQGNLISKFNVAYLSGDSEDFTECNVTIENGVIIQDITHTWNEWPEGQGYPTPHEEKYTNKVHFDLDAKEFIEERR